MDVGAVVGWTGPCGIRSCVCMCMCVWCMCMPPWQLLRTLYLVSYSMQDIPLRPNTTQPANPQTCKHNTSFQLWRTFPLTRCASWPRMESPNSAAMSRMDAMRCDAMRWGERRSTQPGHTAHRTATERPQQPSQPTMHTHGRRNWLAHTPLTRKTKPLT